MHEHILPSEVSPVKDAFCFQNGLNALLILAQKYPQESPAIYSVDTPKGTHAYFVYKGTVFNRGVTWSNDYYPNYSLQEVQQKGQNVTIDLLEQVLGIQEDIHGYGRFIRKRFGDTGRELATSIYKKLAR